MKILITGSNGFIGSNLLYFFKARNYKTFSFTSGMSYKKLFNLIDNVDVIFHTAGTNRSRKKSDFLINNFQFTKIILDYLIKKKYKHKYLIYTSTKKIIAKDIYGISKKKTEDILIKNKKKINLSILRLPNVYGKWSKPNHNSFIATMCYNFSKNIKINNINKNNILSLIYIDDLMILFEKLIKSSKKKLFPKIGPITKTTVGKIYEIIKSFKEERPNLKSWNMKNKLHKNLYSTYLSYLMPKNFKYKYKSNIDPRGNFSELIKPSDDSQISYFSINPGKSRGGHYHFSKVEKFIPIVGKGEIIFENIVTNKIFKSKFNSKSSYIIETIPGWKHVIKNTGKNKSYFIVWTNEKLDIKNPDTYYK